jgi:hypothetical protein
MDSPMYNKMVNESIKKSPNTNNEILKQISRQDQLDRMIQNPKSFITGDLNSDKPWYDFDRIEGEYNRDNYNITIDKNIDNDKRFETAVHELSHATDLAGANIPRADVEKMWKYQKQREQEKGKLTKFFDDEDFNTYVGRPTETRARLNSIRALGKEQGVYNPFTEKIDKSKLDKIKSPNIIRDSQLDQLRKIYNDDQIIDLLNSVSKNDSNKLIPQAQDGGWLDKYAQKGKKLSKQEQVDSFLQLHKPFYDRLMAEEEALKGPSIEEIAGKAQNDYSKFKGDNTRIVSNVPDLRSTEQKEFDKADANLKRAYGEIHRNVDRSERYDNREKKASLNDPNSWHIEDKMRLFPSSIGGIGEVFDDYLNPLTMVGSIADGLGSSVARRDIKGAALSLGMAAGAGALGFDPLGSALKVPGKVAQSMKSGLLSNAYKLNPYAFKPTEGMMYRGIGKEGMEDALQSGMFRAKQDVTPTSIGNFNTTRQFSKAYYSPRFDIADQYGQGFIAEVPRGASDWGKRYGKKEWSQIAQRDIPVTEGKVLQKDWLRGYKEVPNSSTQATAKSFGLKNIADSWPARPLQSTISYLDERIGDLIKGTQNRKDIAEGNKWLQDWIEDPATQKKLHDQMVSGYSRANSAVGVPVHNANVLYGENLWHAQNYKPRATEYPFANQVKDLGNDWLSPTNPNYANVHNTNLGVSYRHGFTPGAESVSDNSLGFLYDKQRGPGTWISRQAEMNSERRRSVTIHEGVHDWFKDSMLNDANLPYKNDINNALTPEALEEYSKWVDNGYKGNALGYLADPTEVHARIMQARDYFNIRPSEKVTEEAAERMLNTILKGKVPVLDKKFGTIFKDSKSLANLFNKLPAVAPVAVGVGAAATALPKEQKNGGWLDKYK